MDLSNYVFSPLRDGDLTLYRGCGEALQPILMAVAERSSPASLNRLEHEYTLRADLDAAWATQPIELSRHRDRLTLVLKDPGGAVLDQLPSRSLGIREFLRIAISLAEGVRQVHARGLIHKDIKPANILVDSTTGGAWLTGFGIASRVPREHQDPEAPEVIAGTLAYMAPEQTGRMNRSVDSRSDLYSLGVTFYEMLTGTLPFAASDPMEWVHCHIARQPPAPCAKATGLPEPLSAIVMKLLAKTAEERYQTAGGLAVDLRLCLAEWETHGRIHPFSLGEHDASDRLLIPERLYGREPEIETLLACFDRIVAQGTPEFVLVSGYSGIGKSAVVNELHRVLVPPRGLYATGKFDQYKSDIPYATLAQAFHGLVRSLLTRSDAELGRWRDSFSEALGTNGQLMVDIVPELELVIGKQPTVPDLPPQDAKNRFHMVFRRFLGVFARKEHPLALFLDDLQWLDTATLDLLEHVITHPEVQHLLLVGAYRDNEVTSSHSLSRTLESIRKADAKVRQIALAPLATHDLGRLIADAVHCQPERAMPLALLVHEKTGGNPFFAIQFLTTLAEEDLLTYDRSVPAWIWDIDRIYAKDYTDNVVDLVIRKLKRLTPTTQEALKHLACMGNMADIELLGVAHQQPADEMHVALWKAVRDGLVVRQGNNYKFLHDRIQQAAYSLLPEHHRPAVHLRIGRMLHATPATEQINDFEVANHFNRGATLLIDRTEKADVAALNLRTGRKAKASAAYASARAYFSAGMALLDQRDWDSRYELMFALWIERAQCELLEGDFHTAEQLLAVLSQRAASNLDRAAVYHLKILVNSVKGEYSQAVDNGLMCLRLLGIDVPRHPTWDQVEAEYDTAWQALDGRPIESLIDLPLLTDPELNAAMQIFLDLTPAAYLTDFHLSCFQMGRVVRLSMQHGVSGAAAHAFGYWGTVLGPVFHRYSDAQRLAKLGCDLVDKHGFVAHRAHVYYAMGRVAFWTQPMGAAIDFMQANYRALIETGDHTLACHSRLQAVTGLLLRNDPLDAVYQESEASLDFVRKAKYGDAADIIEIQRHFIAVMQGRPVHLAARGEAPFEAQLQDRTSLTMSWYWILQLKSRFLLGDHDAALAAEGEVKPLLSAAAAQIQLLDYFYYSALTLTALYEDSSADRQAGWRQLLIAHRERLREWAENNAPTFADKHALVSAEIARVEGRHGDAISLYEQAIKSAREHGFVQNEGLAQELAAGFYASRGVESIAHTYLRNARRCYLRWGALGKVRQLERVYPWLAEKSSSSALSATIDAPVDQLDVGTVVKASQAVSSEIELSKVIETLLRIVLEHAGAERGLLILLAGSEPRIAAEATTGGGGIDVVLRQAAVTPTELPETVLRAVIRTRESVLLEDAATSPTFSQDVYVQQHRPRSVLCVPLVKQGKLVGTVYLENKLTPRVFTSAKLAVLKLLASQAAISLENVRLYDELRVENSERRRAEEGLRRSEAYLSEAQRLSHSGSYAWWPSSGELYWTEEAFRIFEYDPSTRPTLDLARLRLHPDDVGAFQQVAERASEEKRDFSHEYRLRMPDQRVKYIRSVARAFRNDAGGVEFVGAVMDITTIRMAEHELHKIRSDLAHVMRMTSLGELTASIAHEVNQPLGAVMFNAEAALSWLDGNRPNMKEAHSALQRIVRDGTRAGEVIRRVRALANKTESKMVPLSLNEVLGEVLTFVHHELVSSGVTPRVEFASALPVILADKVQLQQVILNLVMNGIEAMQSITDRPRELTIRSQLDDSRHVRATVADCGVGVSADNAERIFHTFYTTKSGGMGIGLSICRSIIELHGGRIWATPNVPYGAAVQFTLPLQEDRE